MTEGGAQMVIGEGRRAQVDRSEFWCGFCKEMIQLQENHAQETAANADERFDHIEANHFRQGQRMGDWVRLDSYPVNGSLAVDFSSQMTDNTHAGPDPAHQVAPAPDQTGVVPSLMQWNSHAPSASFYPETTAAEGRSLTALWQYWGATGSVPRSDPQASNQPRLSEAIFCVSITDPSLSSIRSLLHYADEIRIFQCQCAEGPSSLANTTQCVSCNHVFCLCCPAEALYPLED